MVHPLPLTGAVARAHAVRRKLRPFANRLRHTLLALTLGAWGALVATAREEARVLRQVQQFWSGNVAAKIFRALVRNRRHEADETMVSVRARNDRAFLKRTSGMEPKEDIPECDCAFVLAAP